MMLLPLPSYILDITRKIEKENNNLYEVNFTLIHKLLTGLTSIHIKAKKKPLTRHLSPIVIMLTCSM